LIESPRIEAETLIAMVHGAILSTRVYGDKSIFGIIMDPQLDRMSRNSRPAPAGRPAR
jgi:TetR/AcrR family transcriptional repressor of nem operon